MDTPKSDTLSYIITFCYKKQLGSFVFIELIYLQ